MQAVIDDQKEREEQLKPGSTRMPSPEECEPPASMGPLHKWMYNVEKGLLGPDPEEPVEDVPGLLKGLVSSESAYVVFNTEDDKNTAIEVADRGEVKLSYGSETYQLKMSDLECEPATINW